ncbi:hypothetical protein QTP88_004890 [Uroleucon formosanum]
MVIEETLVRRKLFRLLSTAKAERKFFQGEGMEINGFRFCAAEENGGVAHAVVVRTVRAAAGTVPGRCGGGGGSSHGGRRVESTATTTATVHCASL